MKNVWTDQQRDEALRAYGLPDGSYDQDFDDLAALASEICETPIALVNLVYLDQQYSQAHFGLEARSMPVDQAFCKYTINEDFMLVTDATDDERFASNPLVTANPHIRFYAGATLRDHAGVPLGAFCVIDTKPRTLSDYQQRALKTLAKQAMRLFDLKRSLIEQTRVEKVHSMIVESAVDYAIISTDTTGIIKSWNTGAEQILGWTTEEAIGLNIEAIFTAEDKIQDIAEHEMETSIAEGSARDVRWHSRKDGEKFWASGRMMPLNNDAQELEGYLKIVRDLTAQHQLEQQRANLNEEILHRLKNSITVVQSLAQQSIRGAATLEEAQINVTARLSSYANAHNLLLQEDWSAAPIEHIINEALAPHEPLLDQITIIGPNIKIPSRRVIGLTLALHELITNAIKYGSLSVPTGSVTIEWSVKNEIEFEFIWFETGGPVVAPPQRKGFGSTILGPITSSYFSGKSQLRYVEGGFQYELVGSVAE